MASLLDDSVALIDVDEAKMLIGINSNLDQNTTSRVERIINAASRLISNKTGRKFITPSSAIVETFFGRNSASHYLNNKPIVGTPSELQYYSSNGVWNDVTASWSYVADTGMIYFLDGVLFHRAACEDGIGNWRVTYNYGYTRANIPDDLKLLCADIVQIVKTRFEKNLSHVRSQSFENYSTTYIWKLISDDMRELIMSYAGSYFE